MRKLLRRPLAASIASALIAGTVSVAAVSYAQGDSAKPAAVSAAPGGILAGVHNVLENLVAQGAITQDQADAVQRQANSGTIDPKILVQDRVLTDAQMHRVANAITQLKESGGR